MRRYDENTIEAVVFLEAEKMWLDAVEKDLEEYD